MQKTKQINDMEPTVTFRAVSADEEGRKRVEKTEVHTHNIDTLKHIEKKLIDKGVHRLDRHPRDGIPIEKQSKGGRGGKYTWDGPGGMVNDELDPAPAAVDEKDPNYVSEEEEERVAREAEGVVIGEVEVAKVAEQGVGRVDVDPNLKVD
ncbi:uncharacterized protein LOC111907142 [Lactuca sativa]|uniref:Hyaluronan/mRNA-binding protein domain-containing protein n=1 Tax=Lactuca sativa TaxID=4236 RepID=A0A9R1WCM9_LACSA|nr:uncharacterized protein LOC111907142 [Lactuca sativa]KAJ0221428.1 hypothetical protein LSAT_V11C200058430 [Lactuca sativa]